MKNTKSMSYVGFEEMVKLTFNTGNPCQTSQVRGLRRFSNWCGKRSAMNWCPRYLRSAAYSDGIPRRDHETLAPMLPEISPQRPRSYPWCQIGAKRWSEQAVGIATSPNLGRGLVTRA